MLLLEYMFVNLYLQECSEAFTTLTVYDVVWEYKSISMGSKLMVSTVSDFMKYIGGRAIGFIY